MFWIPLVILIVLTLIALFIIWAFSEEDGLGGFMASSLVSLIILAPMWIAFGYSMSYANTSNVRTCKVQDVVKVNEFEQSTNGARVYCEDGSNYSISDNFMTARFESSNVYNRVKAQKGNTIEVQTIGFRNGLFNSFENIVEIKAIK